LSGAAPFLFTLIEQAEESRAGQSPGLFLFLGFGLTHLDFELYPAELGYLRGFLVACMNLQTTPVTTAHIK